MYHHIWEKVSTHCVDNTLTSFYSTQFWTNSLSPESLPLLETAGNDPCDLKLDINKMGESNRKEEIAKAKGWIHKFNKDTEKVRQKLQQ